MKSGIEQPTCDSCGQVQVTFVPTITYELDRSRREWRYIETRNRLCRECFAEFMDIMPHW